MSKLTSEVVPSVESGTSGNSKVVATDRNQAVGPKTQSCLPLPAGARTSQSPPPKRDGKKASGGAKPGERRSKQPKFSATSKISIDKSVHQYRMTEVYKKAVGAMFKDKKALENFNKWTQRMKGQIDPAAFSMCENCGHIPENLELCECYIRPEPANAEVDKEILYVPLVESKVVWRSNWLNGVRQWFVKPQLDLRSSENPYVGGFSNECIRPDALLKDLYTYLLLRRKADYIVDGVDDRRARVNHFTTLAQSWLLEHKEKTIGQSPELARRVAHTIQRAADDPVHDILLQRSDPVKNKFWQYFSLARMAAKILQNKRLLIMLTPVLLTMLPGRLRLKIYNAFLRPCISYLRRHLQVSAEVLLTGSAHVLRQIILLLTNLVRLLLNGISNGLDFQRQFRTQLPFTGTVATMSSTLSTSGTLNRLRKSGTSIGNAFKTFANRSLDASWRDILVKAHLRLAVLALVA